MIKKKISIMNIKISTTLIQWQRIKSHYLKRERIKTVPYIHIYQISLCICVQEGIFISQCPSPSKYNSR